MKKTRFFVTFLLSFAAFLVVWGRTDAAHWHTRALLAFAQIAGPMLHGWVLEMPPPGRPHPVWRFGENQVEASMQFDALAVGLVPLLALLAATPGVPPWRRLWRMLLGATINFTILGIIIAMFPLLVFYKNPFTDVIGTFLGVVAFVGAPVIIWFSLSVRELRSFLPALQAPKTGPSPTGRKEERKRS
jgi:hypothetical protein